MRGHNIVINCLLYIEFMLGSMNQGVLVDSVYTDFGKVFDSVNHELLITKFNLFGFVDSLLRWVVGYLKGRIQYVRYNKFCFL